MRRRVPRLEKLREIVRNVAEEKGCGIIDMSTLLKGKPEMYRSGDGVHPNKHGARAIAEKVYNALKPGPRGL